MPSGRKRDHTIELKPDNEAVSITLNMSMKAKKYIDARTSNRSEWIKETGRDFLNLLYTFCLPLLSQKTFGRKIVSISKPSTADLEDIYSMVKEHDIFFSRSEFYRLAIILKIMFETINEKDFMRPSNKEGEDHKNGTVRVPTGKYKNEEEIFKVYKVLKKLEY